MNVGKRQKLILYALGEYYKESNKTLKGRSLEVVAPKYVFIDLLRKLKLTEKKPRALYRNLETLEKKKLISYSDKNLHLTAKGMKMFNEISSEVDPYVNVLRVLETIEAFRKSKKSQTVLVLRR